MIKINSKINITLALLFLFYVFYTILEFKYIADIYSCSRLNFCNSFIQKFLDSNSLIMALHFLKLLLLPMLFFKKFRWFSLLYLFTSNIYFLTLNPHTHSPEISYLNYLVLFLLIYLPQLDFETCKDFKIDFEILLKILTTVVLISYSYSGWTKLTNEDWMSGQFFESFFKLNHLVLIDLKINYFIKTILFYMTFYVVFSEFFAFLGLLNRYLMFLFWINLTAMHVVLFFILDIRQVSLGMLIVHYFIYDDFWRKLFNFKTIKSID